MSKAHKEKGIIPKIYKPEALQQSSYRVKNNYTKAIQTQNHTETNIKQISVLKLKIMQLIWNQEYWFEIKNIDLKSRILIKKLKILININISNIPYYRFFMKYKQYNNTIEYNNIFLYSHKSLPLYSSLFLYKIHIFYSFTSLFNNLLKT